MTNFSRDHNSERGSRPTFPTCGNCGGYPFGIGCYHICFNSVYYYTPEQERYDDATYGDDDNRERYAATIEASQYYDEGDYDEPDFSRPATPAERAMFIGPDTSDDLPF